MSHRLTLHRIMADWTGIRTAASLRRKLKAAIAELRYLDAEMANDWDARLKRIPKRVDREACVAILFHATGELITAGHYSHDDSADAERAANPLFT